MDTWNMATRQGLVVALVAALIGLGSYWAVEGTTEAREQALNWAFFGVLPIASLTAAAFVWNLVLAPIRLTREQHSAYVGKVNEQDSLIADLTEQLKARSELEPRIVFKDRLDYQITVGWEVIKRKSVDYPTQGDWVKETYWFLKDALGEGEAQTFFRWVSGPKGEATRPIGLVLDKYMEPLQMRADSVTLRRNFDLAKWARLAPVSDLPSWYRQ